MIRRPLLVSLNPHLALGASLLALGCSGGTEAPAASPTPPSPAAPAPAVPAPAVPSAVAPVAVVPAAPTSEPAWLAEPNVASFPLGAVLVRSDPEGAFTLLDEHAGTSWTLDDAQREPLTEAVVELAARARVSGVRWTFDDYWTVRLPREVVLELGESADGPFREVARLALPEALPETGEAPLRLDTPAAAGAEGRYVRVRLAGRRGGADEPVGPLLSDVAVHGTLLARAPADPRLVGRWNGGWLLGTFEVMEERGRLRACFERDGREADVVVDGRALQLRWRTEEGGQGVAVLARAPDGWLQGFTQTWSASGEASDPGALAVEPLADAEPICARVAEREAPGARFEAQLEGTRRVRVYGILFDFASAVPRPESGATLDELAAALARHPDWQFVVEGHTDAIGDDASNQTLSEQRASAVVEALASRGVDRARATSAGFGETRPAATNDTAPGRAQNRRVEIALR
ncbi:MAG: hypothetical protein OHK0013_48680 [Sandaracinaceae bacterium]